MGEAPENTALLRHGQHQGPTILQLLSVRGHHRQLPQLRKKAQGAPKRECEEPAAGTVPATAHVPTLEIQHEFLPPGSAHYAPD